MINGYIPSPIHVFHRRDTRRKYLGAHRSLTALMWANDTFGAHVEWFVLETLSLNDREHASARHYHGTVL